jgi:hypothetical protein
MRLFVIGLFVGLAVLATVGCGSGSVSSEDLLERSVTRMRAVESFRSESVVNVDSFGMQLEVTQTIEVASGGDFSTTFALGKDEPPAGLIVLGDYVYAEVPVTGWVRVGINDMSLVGGAPPEWLTDPVGFYGIVFAEADVPWSLYSTEVLGNEAVGGVDATHLEVTFDVPEVASRLTGAKKDLVMALAGDVDPTAAAVPFAFDVWIDDAGFARRVVMEVSDARFGDTKNDVRMWDFDEEIVIYPPESYQDLVGAGG